MRKISVPVIAGVVLLASGIAGYALLFRKDGQPAAVTNGVAQSSATYHTCPMHPSVVSDRPGACPVCGMALVKKGLQHESSPAALEQLKSVTLSPTQRVLANVATTTVTRQTIARKITAMGSIAFAEPRQATVAARFRGRIEKLHASSTGVSVRKGDPLFELYSPDLISAEREFILALEAAEQAPGSANTQLESQLLHASRDRLSVHFGLTEEQISGLERDRRIHPTWTFHSPIAGTVLQKLVQVGQYVNEGQVVYELADLSVVWASIDVYEQDLRFVTAGRTVRFTAEAYPGREFHGKVRFVEPVVNADTRTVRVRAELPNPRGELKPNMYVNASITFSVDAALTVPSSAVIATGKRSLVWVEVMENSFEPREVVTGASGGGLVEVLSGLHSGDKVAATGGYLVDSESALQMAGSVEDHSVHAGIGEVIPQPPASETGAPLYRAENDTQRVRILVKGRYSPDVIRVTAGKPVTLQLYRDEDSHCTSEIVFPTLGIRRSLPAWKTTVIEFTPDKPGEIPFECGMSMVDGKIIVEDEP